MTTQRVTNKDRIARLEDEVGCLNRRIDELISLLRGQQSAVSVLPIEVEPVEIPEPPVRITAAGGPALFKKPIMYLYNMTGTSKQVAVNFGSAVIPDAVPAIRDDGKLVFNLDSDGYIDNKYRYLFYEIEYDKPLPKGALTIWISNDKFLQEGLANVAKLCGLWSDEIIDFVNYWDLELKRSDCKYWKCEILTEKELDPIIPIEISPKPDWFIRRYVKFSEDDKGQRISSKTGRDVRISTPPRMGELRVCEWGGMIADSGTIQ